MTTLATPPVPPECDMGGNEWFPLYFDRLRKSKWWRRASDTARARNVMLWGEAYKAVPAGSLPDDDDELAEAAGYGMDVDAFLAVKADIMAPWMLCADGRWYHPTLCEVVLEAWERKSDKRKKDAARQREHRLRARGVPAKAANVTRDIGIVTRDAPENARDIATHNRTGQDNKDADASLSPGTDKAALRSPSDQAAGPPAEPNPDLFLDGWEAFPDSGRKRSSTAQARKVWAPAVKRAGSAERLVAAVRRYAASPEARKEGGQYVEGFHRWLKNERFEHWLDGPDTAAPAPAAQVDQNASWRIKMRQLVNDRIWRELDWGPRPSRTAPQDSRVQVPDVVLAEFGFPSREAIAA